MKQDRLYVADRTGSQALIWLEGCKNEKKKKQETNDSRNSNVSSLYNFSSLSTTRVRQRLCNLMGTDVIRLNDKRYFQKLSTRLQEEYEVRRR